MVIYRSFYDAIIDLPEQNQIEVWNAIFLFGFDGVEQNLTGVSKMLFTLIKPQLEANNRKAEIGKANGEKGAKFGKLGGRPQKEKPANNPQETPIEGFEITPTKPANVNDNVNINANANSNVNENALAVVEEKKTEPKPQRKKKEAPPETFFTDTPEGMTFAIFQEKWNATNFSELHPQIDSYKLWGTMRDWSNENSPPKNKRSDWLAVGRTFVKKDPKEFTKSILPHGATDHLNTADRKGAELLSRALARIDAKYNSESQDSGQ